MKSKRLLATKEVQLLPKVGLLLLILLAACQGGNDSWERVERDGVLRIGLDPSYPPFEVLEDGELKGVDVALGEALADELNLTAHFDIIGYDALYDSLLTERVDVLISALYIDELRTRDFAYSEPYYNAGQVLVTRRDEVLDELDRAVIAVELGADGHRIATEWQKEYEGMEVLTFDSAETALLSLLNNTADATITDNISASLFIAQHPELIIADEAVTVEPFALVVRIDDQILLDKLNTGLATIRANGEWDTILERFKLYNRLDSE